MFFLKGKLADTPKEALNWRLWYGVFVFGLMGAARGLDEGLIGTTVTQVSFRKRYGLDNPNRDKHAKANLEGNITAMVQLGSILGALIGFYLTDKLGRLRATIELCFLWVLGIAIFMASAPTGNLNMVYAGRFIAGIGIGQTTIVAPTYLAETAPRAVRGFCVCMFAGCVYLGIMLSYFASWGSSIHISGNTQTQWLVPNSMHIMFAGLILILSAFALESPRWLIKVGNHEKAAANLSKLRNLPVEHPYVQSEIIDINGELNREREATMGASKLGIIKELIFIPANRYRIMLSIFSQILAQWSGANSITIYAPRYFAMVGQTGQNEKLFATAIFGVVKFVSAIICAAFLIDFIGRKRALYIGISLQAFSMLYMALFLVIDKTVEDKSITQSPSQKKAATGAIVMIYLSGFGWAMGWNSVQYLINSEIYPLRLRAIGGSIAMTVHFANQYGNSKAVPSMFLDLTTYGTMFFFVAVTLIGLFWVWAFIPELSGRSLEAVDAIFDLPWWKIGRFGGAVESNTVSEAIEHGDDAKATVTRLEEVAHPEKA
ncbi:putative quinate permease protein [Venturia nashicola]|uniref:Putative quinate permease protein n=1 Tax=Venturia nashicola TaxID=86259 RepID=A0A4Z1P0F2_9PEZI|nr:putative quinate permease protein [Venturia nashicola]TLD35047.1 putative quinate permease protein [Venturia nashicola]